MLPALSPPCPANFLSQLGRKQVPRLLLPCDWPRSWPWTLDLPFSLTLAIPLKRSALWSFVLGVGPLSSPFFPSSSPSNSSLIFIPAVSRPQLESPSRVLASNCSRVVILPLGHPALRFRHPLCPSSPPSPPRPSPVNSSAVKTSLPTSARAIPIRPHLPTTTTFFSRFRPRFGNRRGHWRRLRAFSPAPPSPPSACPTCD
ncbi:hypothetical protein GQ53DRAFT_188137 [Thozetella sp. PMI_491]|nr:hypothetical protein GQ53DRAFT_188137 [Thozetella sp. PMI_491]